MKILMAASELYPYAKTGGLADVITSLSNEQRGLNHDVRLVIPGYPEILKAFKSDESAVLEFSIGKLTQYKIKFGFLDRVKSPVYVVIAPREFENSSELYPDVSFKLFIRFLILSHATAKIASGKNGEKWVPDVLHANDWHTGLAFNFLEPGIADNIARVFSIHNLAFPGDFPLSYFSLVEGSLGEVAGSQFWKFGKFSFLEEALLQTDKIVTVSENYAREIQSNRFGFGFEGLISKRRRDLSGILNGVDYGIWHPEQDAALPFLNSQFGKPEKLFAKKFIQQKAGFKLKSDAVLCSFTNRFTDQKMIDVLCDVIGKMDDKRFQFVFHGKGEKKYEAMVSSLAAKMPESVCFFRGFSEETEHQFLAGADICLSPSRFEPCGLNALYAMRYGAVPMVRPVGGFVDSVRDEFSREHKGSGNGFYVPAESHASFKQTFNRIYSFFQNEERWDALVERVKRENFSWHSAAQKYISVYGLAQRRRRSVLDFASPKILENRSLTA